MFKYIATAFVAVFVCGCAVFNVPEEDVTIKVRTDSLVKGRVIDAHVNIQNSADAETLGKK